MTVREVIVARAAARVLARLPFGNGPSAPKALPAVAGGGHRHAARSGGCNGDRPEEGQERQAMD